MSRMCKFPARLESLEAGMRFIEEELKKGTADSKSLARCELLCEELLVQMIRSASEDAWLTIRAGGLPGHRKISISCRGERFRFSDANASRLLEDCEVDEDQRLVIGSMILKAYAGEMTLSYSKGINTAQLHPKKKKSEGTASIFLCILCGFAVGLLAKRYLGEAAAAFLSENVFSIVSSVFMNALKMIIAPLVFFSIANGVAGFGDYKVFGKVGTKVIALYFFTTVVAIAIAVAAFWLVRPGDASLRCAVEHMASASGTVTAASLSVRDTLVSLVPDNLLGAFVRSDMLQLIVIAVIVGIAAAGIGEYSEPVQHFIAAGNALFCKITSMIIVFLPVSVFCMMANMAISIELQTLVRALKIITATLLALLILDGFYMLLLAVFGRVRPDVFLKNVMEVLTMAFSTCTSNACIPLNMKALDRLGVSPRIYSFSVPLGATVNMDGASISYIMYTLFMIRIYGAELSNGMLLAIVCAVVLLSAGTPAVAGSSITCQALLLTMAGIPAEAVAFIIPFSALTELFDTMSNVMGDAVVSTVVARSEEGMFDDEKYGKLWKQ